MRTFCFFDFETDSVDPQVARVIEAAWAVFSEDGRMLSSASSTFQIDSVPALITGLTGLRIEHCSLGKQFPCLYSFVAEGFAKSSYICGHNILNYDCEIIKKLNLGEKLLENKVFIDTMIDLPLPPNTTSRKLTHLCADKGIPTPNAHGAMYDCIYAAKLLFCHTPEELNDIIERAKSPLIFIKACVTFDTKDLAKPHKFRWDGKQKIWWRKVRLFDREKIKVEVNGAFTMEVLKDFTPTPEVT